jgi:hypothetical protein
MIYTSPREFCVISIYGVVMTMVSVLRFDGISRWSQTLRRRCGHSPSQAPVAELWFESFMTMTSRLPSLEGQIIGTNSELGASGCTVVVLWL